MSSSHPPVRLLFSISVKGGDMFGKKSELTTARIVKHAIASIIVLKISSELRNWAKK